jgi:hypothetical protein
MELPSVQKQVAEKYGSDEIAVLGFAPGDSPAKLRDFMAAKGYTFRQFTNSYDRYRQFRVTGSPYTVIIDRGGVIRYAKNAIFDDERGVILQKFMAKK